MVEKKARSTKYRPPSSSVAGPAKRPLVGSNCPPRQKIVFPVSAPNSIQTSGEWVTTVRPRNFLARWRARIMQVVLPSRKIVWRGVICSTASRAISSFSRRFTCNRCWTGDS